MWIKDPHMNQNLNQKNGTSKMISLILTFDFAVMFKPKPSPQFGSVSQKKCKPINYDSLFTFSKYCQI